MLTGRFPDPVAIRLPRGGSAIFPLALAQLSDTGARAGVVKDAGDDPDITHGALIIAETAWAALGCGIGPTLDMAKLRYGRVFLLMDADSDGHHIATLLLTFFYRHLRPLIVAGVVHLSQPPLYRIDIGKETYWALDEPDRDRILKEKVKGNAKPSITRFKGLGEMQAADLKTTTLDPKHRSSLRVAIANELETDRVINDLLGRDVSARFKFIMERAGEVAGEELDV